MLRREGEMLLLEGPVTMFLVVLLLAARPALARLAARRRRPRAGPVRELPESLSRVHL